MASSTDSLAHLSTQQRLLLAQAAASVAEGEWGKVADLLKQHPLLKGEACLQSAKSCSSTYATLAAEYPPPSPSSLPTSKRKHQPSPAALLCFTLYNNRISEIQSTIAAEESRFRILNAEIEEIKRGDWDDKLRDPTSRATLLDQVKVKLEEEEEEQVEGSPRRAVTRSRSPPKKSKTPSTATQNKAKSAPPTKSPRRSMRGTASVEPVEVIVPAENEDKKVEPEANEPAADRQEEENNDNPVELAGNTKTDAILAEAGPSTLQSSVSPPRKSKKKNPPSTVPTSTRRRLTRGTIVKEEDETEEAVNEVVANDEESKVIEVEQVKDDVPDNLPSANSKRVRDAPEDTTESSVAKKKPKADSEAAESPVELLSVVPTPDRQISPDPVQRKRLLQLCSQLTQHPRSAVFRDPVRPRDAPDYTSVIKRPMDLARIRKRIASGSITCIEEFERDVTLMLANAVMYNRIDSDVAKSSHELLTELQKMVGLYVSTQYS